MESKPLLPFIYLTNFLFQHQFEDILNQVSVNDDESDAQTSHLVNVRGVHTWCVREKINRVFGDYTQKKILKIKGGNILAFYDRRGMDYHQDSVPNANYPNDPEIGFAPNASAVYYINDDYQGGEVCFSVTRPSQPQPAPDDNQITNLFTLKPQPNSCLFFDANLWHWVRPVTDGKRFSSTFFLLVE